LPEQSRQWRCAGRVVLQKGWVFTAPRHPCSDTRSSPRSERNGKMLTYADLDECHGITGLFKWDGGSNTMHHGVVDSECPFESYRPGKRQFGRDRTSRGRMKPGHSDARRVIEGWKPYATFLFCSAAQAQAEERDMARFPRGQPGNRPARQMRRWTAEVRNGQTTSIRSALPPCPARGTR
jgi:hypothetical protein